MNIEERLVTDYNALKDMTADGLVLYMDNDYIPVHELIHKDGETFLNGKKVSLLFQSHGAFFRLREGLDIDEAMRLLDRVCEVRTSSTVFFLNDDEVEGCLCYEPGDEDVLCVYDDISGEELFDKYGGMSAKDFMKAMRGFCEGDF